MKKSVKKTIMAALLSLSILCTTAFVFPASVKAATESTNVCAHLSRSIKTIYTKNYPHASQYDHQVYLDADYECNDCHLVFRAQETYTEPHQQVPGTVYCICGYYLH